MIFGGRRCERTYFPKLAVHEIMSHDAATPPVRVVPLPQIWQPYLTGAHPGARGDECLRDRHPPVHLHAVHARPLLVQLRELSLSLREQLGPLLHLTKQEGGLRPSLRDADTCRSRRHETRRPARRSHGEAHYIQRSVCC